MPSKKRREKVSDKAKAWHDFEAATKRVLDTGQLSEAWRPNEIFGFNAELGTKIPWEFYFGDLNFDKDGQPIKSKVWTKPEANYRAGGERMAEKARNNYKYLKELAGDLWGQTDRIPEIRQRVHDDLRALGLETDIIPCSDRTLRRHFKLDP